jgi:hypothetical protein
MLRRALANKDAENRSGNVADLGADLYYNEAKAGYFHLTFRLSWSRRAVPNPKYSDLRRAHAEHHFDDGEPGYAAAAASISRAAYRLQKRGLAVCMVGDSHWSGINLTDAGIGYIKGKFAFDITDTRVGRCGKSTRPKRGKSCAGAAQIV